MADVIPPAMENDMSIARCIEVIAQSQNGFDAACQAAVDEASQTVRGLSSLWVKNAECKIENNKITV